VPNWARLPEALGLVNEALMKSIAIDQITGDVYECVAGLWHSVWPSGPIISVAAFVELGEDAPVLPDLNRAETVFREDSFDPVTRVRRGRFYQSSVGSRVPGHNVRPHPVYGVAGALAGGAPDGLCTRQLFPFDQLQGCPPQEMIAIGSSDSLWRVLGAERIISSEHVVTLKARHGLGILPELNSDIVPNRGREKVIETVTKLADSAYRETPGSIVDRALDAAQWCLGTWADAKRPDESPLHRDLGDLINFVDNWKDKPIVILSASRIVARLHARGKPNEQEKRSLRPLMEADAEFALAALGLLLREFGWTR
jgi:hypothetical protein